ncbi:MAG: LuxR C-terminal-related transcriptional regulator [Cellvibrionales bacterium]|jgi:DNA-binding CsgD family transcriptional regulator
MVNLQSFTRWNHGIASVIGAVGREDFFTSLLATVGEQVAHVYPQIWLYHRDLPPRILYHEIPKNAVELQIDRYLEGPYREDPFYQISMNSPRSSIYRLGRLTGGTFEESGYYRDYYGDTGTCDEVIFLTKLDDGSVVNFCIMRLNEEDPFSSDEYDLLYSLSETVAALIQSHCQRDEFASTNLLEPGLDAQIDQAFQTFGSDYVSQREREVLELMLRGYGADTSAERLDISLETVRRHRKTIYKKLDVSCQAELFSLFINSMPYLGRAQGKDPLSIYMG